MPETKPISLSILTRLRLNQSLLHLTIPVVLIGAAFRAAGLAASPWNVSCNERSFDNEN